MFFLLTIPIIIGSGYYYYHYKNRVLNSALDLYASIVVYSKDKLKYIKNDNYISNHVKLIYYKNNTSIERVISEDFNEMPNLNEFINLNYNIIDSKDIRVLFSYKFNSTEYLTYIAKNKKPIIPDRYPLITKDMENEIDNKYYTLLNTDLKDIQYVKLFNKETNKSEIDIDENLKKLFTKLKGPNNDWGLLKSNIIRNKWIFDDFKINKKYKIIIHQGLYLNDDYELKSDIINIEYNDDFIKLPTLLNLLEK